MTAPVLYSAEAEVGSYTVRAVAASADAAKRLLWDQASTSDRFPHHLYTGYADWASEVTVHEIREGEVLWT